MYVYMVVYNHPCIGLIDEICQIIRECSVF